MMMIKTVAAAALFKSPEVHIL